MVDSTRNEFSISLNMAEGRIIFQALAELPFKYVYELIGKLNHQANASIADSADGQALKLRMLSPQELHLMLKALEKMPFSQVNNLLTNLNAQIQEQIEN
jgi:hypothetical protein